VSRRQEVRLVARIVVGVDGSDESHRALEWAIAEASRWGASLLVVHAWRFGVSPTDPNAAEATREIGRAAQHVVDHEVAYVRESGVEVEGVLVFASPARALVDRSADADLLVVGSRGRGGVAATLLGSVSTACVRHARCPVVVVPATDRAAVECDEEAPDGAAG
jgi:nucleotide-binding universal stress UspA family protein